jgi:hypothetical protein
MKESSTYQAILEEGRGEGEVREARKVLRMQCEDAFGPPSARIAAALDRIHDLSRLEELCKRVRTATSWQDLLAEGPSRQAGRRRPT